MFQKIIVPSSTRSGSSWTQRHYVPLKHWELHNQLWQNTPQDLNLLRTSWYTSIMIHGTMCQTSVHWTLTVARNLNLIYVNTVIYKQHFHQLILHVMCLPMVEKTTIPPKRSWTIKLTAVDSQWLLKPVWRVTQCCSHYYNITATNLIKKFPTHMETKDPLPYHHIIIF